MAGYILQDLLTIRERREQVASENLTKARTVLENAVRLVEQRKRELEEFKVWRVDEEKGYYDEIMNKKVRKEDLDILKSKLAKLERQELEKIQAIDNARDEREAAKVAVEEARLAYNKAMLGTQKIAEHKESWMEEYKKEQEAIVELEMEDFRTKDVVYEF